MRVNGSIKTPISVKHYDFGQMITILKLVCKKKQRIFFELY